MSELWAMEPISRMKIQKLQTDNPLAKISASVIEKFEEKKSELSAENFLIVNGVAIISIRGFLGPWPTVWGYLSDGSMDSYPLIIEKLGLANSNDTVSQIRLLINSGGGRLDGAFDLFTAIKASQKPVEAIVGTRADSAAYGIASQADRIIAVNETSEVGSIGIATAFFVSDRIVDIASTDAPNKRPDVTTEEGVSVVRGELDEFHSKFAKLIAEGRSAATGRQFTESIVNSDFGRGGTMLAEAGLNAGMIDEIKAAPARVSNAAFFQIAGSSKASGSKQTPISKKMDLKTLKSQHPDACAAAIAEGVSQERERVQALLETGQTCGKLDYAVECVANGKCITQPTVAAKFMTAQINAAAQEARGDDDPADIDPDPDASGDDENALVAKYVAKRKQGGVNA